MMKKLLLLIFVPAYLYCGLIDVWNRIENFFTKKEENVGLAWLKISPNARAVGLGEAYVSVADEPSSVWWNPSCLVKTEDIQISFTHNQYFQGIRQNFLGVTNRSGKNSYGIGIVGMFIEGIEHRNKQQEYNGDYGAYNFLISFSYARILSEDLFLGVTIKKLFERIYIYELSSWAADLGFIFIPYKDLYIGGTIINLGPSTKFSKLMDGGKRFKQPIGWRIGSSYKLPHLLLSADIHKYIDSSAKLGIGFEFIPTNILALRFGNIIGGDTRNFSFGFGIKVRDKISIDYTYCPYSHNLGPSHIFTITTQ